MNKIIYLSVILPMVFAYSCASKSNYQQLKNEFEQLKYDSRNQYSELHNDMALSKKA